MKVCIRNLKSSVVALTVTTAFLLTSCSSDDVKLDAPDCVFPDAQSEPAPGWICDEPVDGVAVSAVGVVVKQYAEVTGAADTETIDKVNTSVTKQITDESLVGTKIYKTRTSPNGALYILVGMDSALATAATENALKSSMNNDRAAWQQFRAEKGQAELASSIANMK